CEQASAEVDELVIGALFLQRLLLSVHHAEEIDQAGGPRLLLVNRDLRLVREGRNPWIIWCRLDLKEGKRLQDLPHCGWPCLLAGAPLVREIARRERFDGSRGNRFRLLGFWGGFGRGVGRGLGCLLCLSFGFWRGRRRRPFLRLRHRLGRRRDRFLYLEH